MALFGEFHALAASTGKIPADIPDMTQDFPGRFGSNSARQKFPQKHHTPSESAITALRW
ncbi:MAG: hypothetical protein HUU55_02175 [Myxococcales bacterium]|nr:hypothetical protein [Myxococcales bacterium]